MFSFICKYLNAVLLPGDTSYPVDHCNFCCQVRSQSSFDFTPTYFLINLNHSKCPQIFILSVNLVPFEADKCCPTQKQAPKHSGGHNSCRLSSGAQPQDLDLGLVSGQLGGGFVIQNMLTIYCINIRVGPLQPQTLSCFATLWTSAFCYPLDFCFLLYV